MLLIFSSEKFKAAVYTFTYIGQSSDQYKYSDQARKLKEFLEDYDDERDDPKFYKGRELQRRLADRYKFVNNYFLT